MCYPSPQVDDFVGKAALGRKPKKRREHDLCLNKHQTILYPVVPLTTPEPCAKIVKNSDLDILSAVHRRIACVKFFLAARRKATL